MSPTLSPEQQAPQEVLPAWKFSLEPTHLFWTPSALCNTYRYEIYRNDAVIYQTLEQSQIVLNAGIPDAQEVLFEFTKFGVVITLRESKATVYPHSGSYQTQGISTPGQSLVLYQLLSAYVEAVNYFLHERQERELALDPSYEARHFVREPEVRYLPPQLYLAKNGVERSAVFARSCSQAVHAVTRELGSPEDIQLFQGRTAIYPDVRLFEVRVSYEDSALNQTRQVLATDSDQALSLAKEQIPAEPSLYEGPPRFEILNEDGSFVHPQVL